MQAVIFDFDGTIVDSLGAVIRVVEAITKREVPFSQSEIEDLQHKDPLEIALELGVQKWKIPWLLFKGRRMFRDHMGDIQIHDGLPEVIKALQAGGVPLYVLSSNSKSNVETYLRHHKLDGYFRGIYGGAGILGKSHKLHLLFKDENVEATGSWYVGDETRDIISAHAVGLKIVAVSWGYNSRRALLRKKPDVLADKPSEIVRALQKDGLLQ